MSFLILPGADGVPQLPEALARRLCPYDRAATRRLAAGEHTAYVTQDPPAGGTAWFELCEEEGALVVRTDPLGTCPVWFARHLDGWLVATEVKALAAARGGVTWRPEAELDRPGARPADFSPFADVHRLPPGCALVVRGSEASPRGTPHDFAPDGAPDGAPSSAPEFPEPPEGWPASLARPLDARARASQAAAGANGRGTGCYVSGGIDSSIACALARRAGPLQAFTLRTPLGDEREGAAALADALDCPLRVVDLDGAGAREALERVAVRNEIFDGLTGEIVLQLEVLTAAAAETCDRVVTGYGSDLLFDGMLRHAAYLAAVGLSTTPELIARTRWTGELAPFVHWAHGVAAEHVFWDPAVLDAALAIPRELCFVDGVEKRVLRDAAVEAGWLTESLALRPKVGMTDGTRANRLLSDALGLAEAHAYDAKTRICREALRRAL